MLCGFRRIDFAASIYNKSRLGFIEIYGLWGFVTVVDKKNPHGKSTGNTNPLKSESEFNVINQGKIYPLKISITHRFTRPVL